MPSLTPEQVQIIKATVPVLKEHGNAITTSFYATLLAENPTLNAVFNQANQANNHQATALASSLYAYATHIDDLGVLSPAVEKICHKHASLYIRSEQYDVVGTYLLRAMGDVLGAALTPEILDAWGVAYWQLANIMIGREEQLLQEADGWTDWRDLRIADKVKESNEITSFYLQPVDRSPLPDFFPGQYISVMMEVPKLEYAQSRQYSLSDAPNRKYYRISVKKEAGLDTKQPEGVRHPGYISNILHDEKDVDDVIRVSHPFGEFALNVKDTKNDPIVLLSAGVGITPLISMLNSLASQETTRPVSFIHGARISSSRAFHTHVQNLAQDHKELAYTSFLKEPDSGSDIKGKDYTFAGRLRMDKLDRNTDLFADDGKTQYFVCGPESFMADTEKYLIGMAVAKERVHLEVFGTGLPGS